MLECPACNAVDGIRYYRAKVQWKQYEVGADRKANLRFSEFSWYEENTVDEYAECINCKTQFTAEGGIVFPDGVIKEREKGVR